MFIVYLSPYLSSLYLAGHHECEILGGGPEAAESEYLWRECKKNPGHEGFISAKDFKDYILPKVHNDKRRDVFRAMIDLTVRLRVSWTSAERPDGYPFCDDRGTDKTRVGTGWIDSVSDPVSDEPCPCVACNGEITRKFWRFSVQTAIHAVYNTEEAKSTKVDLFYDDDSCRLDGRMVTVTGLEVLRIYHEYDVCVIMCVTHDEALGERIKSASRCWDVRFDKGLDLPGLLPCDGGSRSILIVSHPHGQPKKITLGQLRDDEHPLVEYNAATCRGSSGAPVFLVYPDLNSWRCGLMAPPVHIGSFTSTSTQHRKTKQEHRNYGYDWFYRIFISFVGLCMKSSLSDSV